MLHVERLKGNFARKKIVILLKFLLILINTI